MNTDATETELLEALAHGARTTRRTEREWVLAWVTQLGLKTGTAKSLPISDLFRRFDQWLAHQDPPPPRMSLSTFQGVLEARFRTAALPGRGHICPGWVSLLLHEATHPDLLLKPLYALPAKRTPTKLSPDQRIDIVRRAKAGEPVTSIAQSFGVWPNAISYILILYQTGRITLPEETPTNEQEVKTQGRNTDHAPNINRE